MDDFLTGEDTDLVIDWNQFITYNTIMALAAGASLVFIVMFFRAINRRRDFQPDGWALGAGVLGLILTLTGAHMTLTWPLPQEFAFDNIIFGETSLGLGVLMLAVALYLWKRGHHLIEAPDPVRYAASIAKPLSIFIAGLGLALVAIAVAGVVYQLFTAPPEEPISGWFSRWPIVEAIFISLLYGMIGIGAVLFPVALRALTSERTSTALVKTIGWLWLVPGVILILFGAMNFYTHIGLIVNTI